MRPPVHCDTAMQGSMADLREAEAHASRRFRVDQSAKADALRRDPGALSMRPAARSRVSSRASSTRAKCASVSARTWSRPQSAGDRACRRHRARPQVSSRRLAQSWRPCRTGSRRRARGGAFAGGARARALRASARHLAAGLRRACAVGCGRPARDAGRARPDRAATTSQQHRLLQQRERHETERSASRSSSRRWRSRHPGRAGGSLARDAGQKAAADLAQLLHELATSTRSGARAERGA